MTRRESFAFTLGVGVGVTGFLLCVAASSVVSDISKKLAEPDRQCFCDQKHVGNESGQPKMKASGNWSASW